MRASSGKQLLLARLEVWEEKNDPREPRDNWSVSQHCFYHDLSGNLYSDTTTATATATTAGWMDGVLRLQQRQIRSAATVALNLSLYD